MVARDHILEELSVVHSRQVRVRLEVEDGTLHILNVEGMPNLLQGVLDLLSIHMILMCDVLHLLQDSDDEVVLLVEDIAKVLDRLSHLSRLRALCRLHHGPLRVGVVVPVVQRILGVHHHRGPIRIQQGVAELVVAHLPVLPSVEVPHDLQHVLRSQLEAELLEGLLELCHGEHAVMISVEAPEDVPDQGVLLAHGVAHLLQDRLQIKDPQQGVRVLEDLLRVLIHVHDEELVVVDLDGVAWDEVVGLEELACDLIHVNSFLQEAARDNTQVPLRRLVDGHGVVLQVVADDENAVRILRFGIRELGLEAQDLALLTEELHKVLLGHLGDEVRHRAHGVVPRPVARVGRSLGPGHGAVGQAHVDARIQIFVELPLEVPPSELICVVDEEGVVAQQLHCHVHPEVVAMNKLVLLPRLRLRALHLVGAHRHLAAPEEDREVVPSAVQRVLLSDLDGVVRQEEHDGEGPALELRSGDIIHHSKEAQHLLVLLEELLHVRVDVAAAQHHLSVHLLVRPGLYWRMALHGVAGLLEGIRLLGLRRPLGRPRLLEVLPRERIAVCDKDAPAIDLQGLSHSQVLSFQVPALRRGEAMATNQLALGHAAVVLLGLLDLASVVLQVVVDRHLPHTVVLQVRLDHRLLEVAAEAQHVAVEGVPGRELLELDVPPGVLEDRPRLAVRQRAAAPDVLHFAHLHKLRLVMGEPLLLLDSHAVDHVPGVRPCIAVLVLWESVPRKIRQRFQICR
mmetsp:Transcript_111056/g.265084  ORF Transcript_111056/g.265084 Transcript_111056/m.265084 type:complete len:738 (-) Transcript_111056:71-2284(-)